MSDDTAATNFLADAACERDAVEERCSALVDTLASHHPRITEAIRYTLLGGGKRLRPVLCLWTHDFIGGARRNAALDAACAVECVHTYSLIHDDLPCMDDDDLRRGHASAHVQFGEAVAVLTGDALLTLAFEILATMPDRHANLSCEHALSTMKVLAGAAGTGGLITGQALDLESEGSAQATTELVDRIHTHKTGALIAAAMELGAIVGGAGPDACSRVRGAGILAGRAFQIVDDVLDLETDEETLGKTPGKDVKEGKLTYPSIVGMERARLEARSLADESGAALRRVEKGGDIRPLISAMEFIVDRVS